MTISNTLAEQIQQDIEEQQIKQQVSQVAPQALLSVLATLLRNSQDCPDDPKLLEITLSDEEFQELCEKLIGVIGIMGHTVSAEPDEENDDILLTMRPVFFDGDGQAPGNSYE